MSGYLDMRDEGYGFLRVKGYLPSRDDAYIPVKLARQYGLRKGDHVTGLSRPAGRNEKNPALLEIHTVNGGDPEAARRRPRFEDLTALFPDEKLRLEDPADPTNMTARIIDLVAPIGKGQRGIIVSPPKAGKTTVMKTIATSIEANNPEVKLIVLLIDERPEEVTDIRRTVQGEVISSTFDRPSDEHTHVAELAIEKAKRLVEQGEDVVVILDGITRLSRAYNLAAPASGRILSGGIDAGALYPPKKFFGAARNVEEGGSLTILATALVDTNSRMDEAIFEEFKGTGNMELRLDRRLAERRIYPAIDVDASSTRHEELLFDRKQLQMVWKLRRVLSGLAADGNAAPGLELLIDRLQDVPHQRRVPQRDRQATRRCRLAPRNSSLGRVSRGVAPAGRRSPDSHARCGRPSGHAGRYTGRSPFSLSECSHEDRHPSHVRRDAREVLVRQHLHHPLDQGRRAAHRALQRVPPVLHRQAEAGRLRWPRRALQQALRRPQVRQVGRRPTTPA